MAPASEVAEDTERSWSLYPASAMRRGISGVVRFGGGALAVRPFDVVE